MMIDGSENTVLQEVSEWRQRGIELRTKLMTERTALSTRLREIDEALAQIPDPSQLPQAALATLAIDENSSTPEIVRFVVLRHPEGRSAPEIVEEIRRIKPTLDATVIHSAIYRLAKNGEIASRGKRGTKRYWPKEATIANTRTDVVRKGRNGKQHPRKGEIAPDSLVGRAIAVLKEIQGTLHINDIITRMEAQGGRPINKMSLIGGLSRSAKEGRLIYRGDRSNTYGYKGS